MIGDGCVLSFEEKKKRTPKNHGHWTGERGNSRFYSDKKSVQELGAEYVDYRNEEPDFSRFSVCTVEIPSMTNNRYPYSRYYQSNFEQSYEKIAQMMGLPRPQVRKWLRKKRYTIHESSNLKTVYVIPIEIHKTYIHAGGVAECNAILEDEEEDMILDKFLNYQDWRASLTG